MISGQSSPMHGRCPNEAAHMQDNVLVHTHCASCSDEHHLMQQGLVQCAWLDVLSGSRPPGAYEWSTQLQCKRRGRSPRPRGNQTRMHLAHAIHQQDRSRAHALVSIARMATKRSTMRHLGALNEPASFCVEGAGAIRCPSTLFSTCCCSHVETFGQPRGSAAL
jgi:hypothetical protein